jgi:hypothetical protein
VNESIAAALDTLCLSACELAASVGSSKTSIVLYRGQRQDPSAEVVYRLSVFLRYHASRLRVDANAIANELRAGGWRDDPKGRAACGSVETRDHGSQQQVTDFSPARRVDALRLAVARALSSAIVTQTALVRETRWHRLALWRVRTGRVLPFRSELVALEAALRHHAGAIQHETNILDRLLADDVPPRMLRKPSARVRTLILGCLSRAANSAPGCRGRTAPEIAREGGLHRVSVDRALEWMRREREADVQSLHAGYRRAGGRRLPRAWALTTQGAARWAAINASTLNYTTFRPTAAPRGVSVPQKLSAAPQDATRHAHKPGTTH